MNDRELAAALALSAVKLVRRLRVADRFARLTGPQASALGVVVHARDIRMSQLARFEEVGRPAITKTVAQLEGLGLVIRARDAGDGRASLISATPAGERLFHEGHTRRTAPLAAAIGELNASDRDTLASAVQLVELLSHSIAQTEVTDEREVGGPPLRSSTQS